MFMLVSRTVPSSVIEFFWEVDTIFLKADISASRCSANPQCTQWPLKLIKRVFMQCWRGGWAIPLNHLLQENSLLAIKSCQMKKKKNSQTFPEIVVGGQKMYAHNLFSLFCKFKFNSKSYNISSNNTTHLQAWIGSINSLGNRQGLFLFWGRKCC